MLRMPYNSPYQSWSHFDFEYEGIASIQSIFLFISDVTAFLKLDRVVQYLKNVIFKFE